jgi:hypothetical protein
MIPDASGHSTWLNAERSKKKSVVDDRRTGAHREGRFRQFNPPSVYDGAESAWMNSKSSMQLDFDS